METRQGKSVFSGVAIGKLFVFKKAKQVVEKRTVEDTAAEVARYMAAKEKAGEQLKLLKEKTMRDVGEAEAEIFEAHQMLLEDLDFVEGITGMIEQDKVNAEYAVFVTGEQCAAIFMSMDDDYMRGRAADINDISGRLIAILSGTQVSAEAMPEPVIILAEDLAPSETVQFEKDKILAIVTQKGSANSHTAILARTMGIPAILGVPVQADWNGRTAVLDGGEGLVILDPEADLLERYRRRQQEEIEERARLERLKGAGDVTLDGREIQLMANIGSARDIEEVLEQDGAGVGLFRSEYLYLGREESPSEEEQYLEYKSVLQKMQGKRVVIRP